MWLKPILLGGAAIADETLAADKKSCKKFGPCGVGQQALYLNSFYIDRRFYVPVRSVSRVFKRVAMSRGGFSGKGAFASIPYLVVEYDGGKEKQCNFKHEADVDRMLDCIAERFPSLPLHSRAAEAKLQEKEAKRLKAERNRPPLTETAKATEQRLKEAESYLSRRPALCRELSDAARQKRSFLNGNHSYKWVALSILALGAAAFFWGLYLLLFAKAGFAIYFTLFGLAIIFLFSSANVRPTLLANRKRVLQRDEAAKQAVEAYISGFPDFPLPARYAHPLVLKRMRNAVACGKADTAETALACVKEELRQLNKDVTVEQEEFDEIVQIKAMFLNEAYQ